MEKMKSAAREMLNKITHRLISNERIRKKLVVKYYNIPAIFSGKVRFASERDYLLNYKKIVTNKKHICHEEYRANAFYGIADCLKQYSGFCGTIHACVEHGVYFGDYVNESECKVSGFPAIFTFGSKRIEHLREKSNKLIFAVGPYIYYAHDLLQLPEIDSIKKAWGKTLLVFPTHSVDRVTVQMNSLSLIKKIEDFRNEHFFSTVLVCLYYRDIELGRDQDYLKAGYRVVTAGRREDKDFLNRLHTFFSLADYSVSNNVGTHIGYSIAMDTPHMILAEDVVYDTASKFEEKHVTTLHNSSAVEEKRQVSEAFTHYSETITESQRKICNLFWGNDLIRKPIEIRYMLELSDEIFRNTRKKETEFGGYIRKIYGKSKDGDLAYIFDQAMSGVRNI